MTGAWASLFSGGKDSAFALYRALEEDLPVQRLVTVHPGEDSYMYHVPATELAALAAESAGIELVAVDPGELDAAGATDSGAQGDAELEPLEAALAALDDELRRDGDGSGPGEGGDGENGDRGGLAGITAGAVESEFQTSRIEAMAERLGVELFAPLWQRDPDALAAEMLDAGFEIRIVQVAAAGLDESWLGRTLDRDALAELRSLREAHGVHLLGEGGEFETIVVDGPHMDRRIGWEASASWDGSRGRLMIEDAWLE